jgi:hypothetical protein
MAGESIPGISWGQLLHLKTLDISRKADYNTRSKSNSHG